MISTVLCSRFYKIFVSPMLHRKRTANRCPLFLCSKLSAAPSAKLAHIDVPRKPFAGTCCAPRAVIGLWRTATIDTAHRNGIPVRLFGGGRCQGGEKSLSS